eukprot:49449-Amorphochlora_amoeboformis.AAC.1
MDRGRTRETDPNPPTCTTHLATQPHQPGPIYPHTYKIREHASLLLCPLFAYTWGQRGEGEGWMAKRDSTEMALVVSYDLSE